jgi:ribose/xylose/arabinose/galactoside ABC-type transport system permease subunit
VAAAGGIAAAAACGAVSGSLITMLRLPPFVVSLGMWSAVRGFAEQVADNRMVYPPAAWTKTWLYGLLSMPSSRDWWRLLPAGVWLLLSLAVLVALALRYTRFGRHVFAIGSNEQAARLCGVPVARTKVLVYVAGATLAGVAGVLEFSFITMGDPTTRNGAELDVIAAVVIGGASLSGGYGSIFGTLMGALIMTMVANGCTKLGLENPIQKIATGGIILFANGLDRLRHPRN